MLDIEYITAMGEGTETVYFYYTPGEQPDNPGSEPFLVWLYNISNTTNYPLVISVSYGDDESGVNEAYYFRVGTEF